MEERLALRDQARIIRERPGTEDFALGTMSDPESRSIAAERAGFGSASTYGNAKQAVTHGAS